MSVVSSCPDLSCLRIAFLHSLLYFDNVLTYLETLGRLLEFYVRPAIFGMISRFTLKCREKADQLIDTVAAVSQQYGLEISTRKTKVMTTEEATTMLKIVCNGEVLEQVNSFRYLGAIITSTGD